MALLCFQERRKSFQLLLIAVCRLIPKNPADWIGRAEDADKVSFSWNSY